MLRLIFRRPKTIAGLAALVLLAVGHQRHLPGMPFREILFYPTVALILFLGALPLAALLRVCGRCPRLMRGLVLPLALLPWVACTLYFAVTVHGFTDCFARGPVAQMPVALKTVGEDSVNMRLVGAATSFVLLICVSAHFAANAWWRRTPSPQEPWIAAAALVLAVLLWTILAESTALFHVSGAFTAVEPSERSPMITMAHKAATEARICAAFAGGLSAGLSALFVFGLLWRARWAGSLPLFCGLTLVVAAAPAVDTLALRQRAKRMRQYIQNPWKDLPEFVPADVYGYGGSPAIGMVLLDRIVPVYGERTADLLSSEDGRIPTYVQRPPMHMSRNTARTDLAEWMRLAQTEWSQVFEFDRPRLPAKENLSAEQCQELGSTIDFRRWPGVGLAIDARVSGQTLRALLLALAEAGIPSLALYGRQREPGSPWENYREAVRVAPWIRNFGEPTAGVQFLLEPADRTNANANWPPCPKEMPLAKLATDGQVTFTVAGKQMQDPPFAELSPRGFERVYAWSQKRLDPESPRTKELPALPPIKAVYEKRLMYLSFADSATVGQIALLASELDLQGIRLGLLNGSQDLVPGPMEQSGPRGSL